jgi:preprotein translocase subunit SecF
MFKLYNEKNYKKYMIIPLIFAIIALYLIFINPGIKEGIDIKGGNQIIVHYKDQKDYSNLENEFRDVHNLSEIKVSETKTPTDYGLLIEFSSQPTVDQAKENKKVIDFENNTLDSLKEEVNTLLTPLLNKGYLKEEDLSKIQEIKNISELEEYTNEKILEANTNFNSQILSLLKEELDLEDDSKIRIREVAPTLGSDFAKSSTKVGIVAFILLIIVILLFFREIVPSGLIIFAALFDILAAVAGMTIFNIALSLTTIPALLMLIGYSVDTDVLLSTRLLKDKKDPYMSANKSLQTGITMTTTTLFVILAMLIISYYTQMLIILEIAVVLVCGLVGDLISTWFFNAPALISYVNKKKK